MKTIIKLMVAVILLTTSVGIAKAERAVGDKFKSGKLWYEVTSTSPKEVKVVPKSDNWPYWENGADAPKGSVTVPKQVEGYKVTVIGKNAFANCHQLTSLKIYIPVIEHRAFYLCDGLREVYLYDEVSTIETQVFNSDKNLHTIKVSNGNSKFCSENGVLFNKDKTTIIKYPEGKKALAYEIPNSVKEIGPFAFLNSKLQYITIPSSVEVIQYSAFQSSIKLKSIISYIEDVGSVVVKQNAFKGVNKNNCKLRVPYGKESDYENAQRWKDFNNIVIYRFEKGDRFKEGQLMYEITYISHSSGSGLVRVVPQFSTYPYWDENTENIRPKDDVVIGNVEHKNYSFKPSELGAGCFYGSEELKSIDMSYSFVEKIKESAFAECYGLEKVVLGSNINELGDYAFSECTEIKEIISKIKNISSVTMYDGLFMDDIYHACKVTVPYGKINDYKSAKHWKNFTNIRNGVNFDKYILLWIKVNKDIKIDLGADEQDTPVKIVAGSNKYDLSVGTEWIGTNNYISPNIATMTIYGNVSMLKCSGNRGSLEQIKVSNNVDLKYLDCSDNGLLSLDVSKNTKLETIDCYDNQIAELDVSKCTELKSFDCSGNKIASLDLSKNEKLKWVYCYNNPFTTETVDKLFCSLPDQTANSNNPEIYILNDANDVIHSAVLASNKQNAVDKNWWVLYADDDSAIPATTGNYVCNPIAVTDVQLNETSKTIQIDDEFTLTATVLPDNATNKAIDWSSDNPAIATVDENGKVKGVAIGEATITVTTQDGNKTAQCVVTVKDKTGLDDVEEGGIMVYPNPVKDVLYIDMGESKDIQVEIYNTTGDKVITARDKNKISVSHLSSGVYFVKIRTYKGVYSKKLIKK